MALDENAQSANVVGSIQQYVNDALADVLNSSNSAIDFGGGLPFRDDSLEQWIQSRLMGPVRPTGMEGPFAPGGARGGEVYWLLNINCFVRHARAASFSNLQIWRLRDAVMNAFVVGNLIPVRDYVATGESIGNLFVFDITADRQIQDPAREELIQHNLQFSLRWTETWNVLQT